jgi:hypothetical protein
MAFDLDSFDFDTEGDQRWVQENAAQEKRHAEDLDRHGKRPNLGDLAPLDRSDCRHPNFLDFLFGDPTLVETPEPIKAIPVRQVLPEDADWIAKNRHWKEKAGHWLDIPNFADHHLFPWASLKEHLGLVKPEVRAAVMAEGFETWATVEHGLPILLAPTAIGTAFLKYRENPYRKSRVKPRKGECPYRPVCGHLAPLLGYRDEHNIWHSGHVDTLFSSTGEETVWRFHKLEPTDITVCGCKCLRAPNIAHDCANRAANLMTNDILLGCAAHRDLSISNLHRGDKLGLKINTSDIGNCDCPSSASLPLAFIFGGEDSVAYANSNYAVGKDLLADITSEGSREYNQKGITPIERRFTFHQFPLDVTKTSANFGPFTYKAEKTKLTEIGYPALIEEWNSKPRRAKAAPWGLFDDPPAASFPSPFSVPLQPSLPAPLPASFPEAFPATCVACV